MKPALKIRYRVRGGCTLCVMCYYVCPVHAISMKPNVTAVIDEEKCIGCGKCMQNCQAEAIVKEISDEN